MKEGFYHRASCQLELAGGFRTVSFFHGFGHGDLSALLGLDCVTGFVVGLDLNFFERIGLVWSSLDLAFGLFCRMLDFYIRLFQKSKKEEVD